MRNQNSLITLLIIFLNAIFAFSMQPIPKYTWKGNVVSYKQYRDSLRVSYLKYCDSLKSVK
jgi:hypothetical protein